MSNLSLYDTEKIQRACKQLKNLYQETRILIKTRCYRRAYLLLDKFYNTFNVQNQINPMDRVVLNKRILYVLQKILFKYIGKKELNNNYKQKGQQIIVRLSLALHEQYIIISQLMEAMNIPNDFRKQSTDHLNIQHIQAQNSEDSVLGNQEYLIQVQEKVDLSQQLLQYLTSLLQSLLYMSYWHKKAKNQTLYQLYAEKACDVANLIQFKYIRQDKKLYNLGSLCTKCFINLSSCLFESNSTQQAVDLLFLRDQPVNIQICSFIEDMYATNKQKSKQSAYLIKKAIKTQIGFLLARTLFHKEIHQYQAAYDNLAFTSFIINNYYPAADEIKKYVQNVCLELIPQFEVQLTILKEFEKIFQAQFVQDSKIQEIIKTHLSNLNSDKEKQKTLLSQYDTENYEKQDNKYINENKYLVSPSYKSSQPDIRDVDCVLLRNSKQRPVRIISFQDGFDSIFSETNFMDQNKNSTFVESRSRRTSLPADTVKSVRSNTIRSVKSNITQSQNSIRASPIVNSQGSIKLLTTTKYFLPMNKKPTLDIKKITNYMLNKDKVQIFQNVQQQVVHLKQQAKSNWEMNQITNFDTNTKIKNNSMNGAFESSLQNKIYQSLIKTSQSKNMVVLKEEFNDFIKDDCFDKKEFHFCKKMLQFKKSQHSSEPQQEFMIRQNLKLKIDQNADNMIIVDKKQRNLNLTKRTKMLLQQDDYSNDDHDQLDLDFQNKKLTPLQKWRHIVLKHKTTFDLENFKINLRLSENKTKRDLKLIVEQMLISPRQRKQDNQINKSAMLIQSQAKTKELLRGVIKEYESMKEDHDKNFSSEKKQPLTSRESQSKYAFQQTSLADSTRGQTNSIKSSTFIEVIVQMGIKNKFKDLRKLDFQ